MSAHPGVHHAPRGGGEVCRGKVGQEWGWMRFSTRIALSPVLHIGFLHNILCKEKFPLRKKSLKTFTMRITVEGLNLGYGRIAKTFEFE